MELVTLTARRSRHIAYLHSVVTYECASSRSRIREYLLTTPTLFVDDGGQHTDTTRSLVLSLSDKGIVSSKPTGRRVNVVFVFPTKYKNRVCARAHETCIISLAKLSEKHPTNGQAVHLFIAAPGKLIVEHVLNSSYGPPRLFSVAFRVRFKNSCEGPVASILSLKD